uniref:Uncharacterized protein n=1 Tax=Glossina brevipalpis TaxID=37001 RepID=A0A1A9WA62_9MUSC
MPNWLYCFSCLSGCSCHILNVEVVVRMQKCSYETFQILARMHLYFELDINTDEFDYPCHEIVYEVGEKFSYSPNPNRQIDAGFLMHLEELKNLLMKEENLLKEGIFRKSGSVSRQNELRLRIQNDSPLHLDNGPYTVHDCATKMVTCWLEHVIDILHAVALKQNTNKMTPENLVTLLPPSQLTA